MRIGGANVFSGPAVRAESTSGLHTHVVREGADKELSVHARGRLHAAESHLAVTVRRGHRMCRAHPQLPAAQTTRQLLHMECRERDHQSDGQAAA